MKATISPTSNLRRDIRAVSAAITGAPTTTPSAYAEITCPAEGSDTPSDDAMSGRSPIATNSVVPMPKPPRARARIAQRRTDDDTGACSGTASVVAVPVRSVRFFSVL